ncbi:16112_t:CDS:1, partial [Racocetra persica]
MSDESTTNAKKSRSLSDAERRLKRRQKKILTNANGRLDRITATHS